MLTEDIIELIVSLINKDEITANDNENKLKTVNGELERVNSSIAIIENAINSKEMLDITLKEYEEKKPVEEAVNAEFEKAKIELAKEDDTYLRITVYMRQNPITKEVEATIQFEDVSSVYARDLLATYMIQHAYDSVGIIDMKYSAFALLINDRGEQGDIMENVPYDPFIKEVTEQRVLEEEKELFLKNSSIDTIRSKLAKEDEYSFLVHSKDQNGNITLGRFGYAYLNKYRETVIATVEDVTRDFEIDELTGLFKYKGFCIRAAEIIRKNPV